MEKKSIVDQPSANIESDTGSDINIIKEQDNAVKEVCSFVETLVIELSRKELYDKIWEVSVTGVAKEFDIPYSQLMKQVKANNIPIPPSGYWTKLSFGKPTMKTPLEDPADLTVSLYKMSKAVLPIQVAENESVSPKTSVLRSTTLKRLTSSADSQNAQNVSVTVEESCNPVETYEKYGQAYNVYNRERLYREVWEKPITEIAKRYNVSDVAIHKVCKSLDIPTPGLGYWAKVRAGKPVKQVPLPLSDKPETKLGMRSELRTQVSKELLGFLSPEDKDIVISVAMQVIIPEENVKMHPKITAHRKRVVEWHKNDRKRGNDQYRRNNDDAPFLADAVSEAALPRVCRIFDALIKALEPLGCSLTDDLSFVVSGEIVHLFVSELKDKINHIPTKDENIRLLEYEENKRKSLWASKPNIRKYDYLYNGKLSFAVANKKSFRDCKSYVVEDCLGDILILLYEASNNARILREELEEEERQRKEEERLREERRENYNLEVERTKALVNEATDYSIACKIRAYILEVEQSDGLSPQQVQWLAWAKKKADWYDPTVKYTDDILGVRKHSDEPEQKKLERAYPSWRF